MTTKTPRVSLAGVKDTSRGQALSEMRRSGASGRHGKYRKDRANALRKAIELDKVS